MVVFPNYELLALQWDKDPDFGGYLGVAILTNQTNSRSIYYLVTKELCYHRPDINTVLSTIILLKRHMMEKGYRKLVIPRLGCGLYQLSWTVMKPLIEEIFLNTGIEIMVCYL